MKQLSAPRLAFLFAGCFLGAGFVSGQELWQFFGCFGPWGFAGLAVSAVLFALCGVLLIRLAQISGVRELDETVIRWNIPWLRHLIAFFQCLFLFSVVAIMVAGGGALVHQLFPNVPAWSASLVFGVLVIGLALRGLDGVATAFSVCVPVIVVTTIAFAVAALLYFGPERFAFAQTGSDNPMLPCWQVAAVTYVAYNIFGSIGILTPFGELVPSRKRVYQGILLGTGLLVLIAVSVLVSLSFFLDSTAAEMPMLKLVCQMDRKLGYVYGLLLLFGIYGTALSCGVALETYLSLRYAPVRTHRTGFLIAMVAVAFSASLVGFGDLISAIYPVFGYLGVLSLVLIFFNWLHYRKRERAGAGTGKNP